jgi:hypothetical protein
MDTLIKALIQVESGDANHPDGNDYAIGDRTLQYSAYGCLQIRWPLVLDINNHFGTSHRARECLGNRALSIDLLTKYMSLYATPQRLGREPTDEDRARIWNGGPAGWLKPSTLGYWQKVDAVLSAQH